MKYRLVILGLFAILVAASVVASRNAVRKPSGLTQSLIVTQDGRLTISQQPGTYASIMLIMDKPKPSTNTSSSTDKTDAK